MALWRFGSEDYFLRGIDELRPPSVSIAADEIVPEIASGFDNSRELANLLEKSLLRTGEILNMDLPRGEGVEDEATNARARVLLSAARTVFQTQLRADGNVLKRRATQAHTKMLRELKDVQARLADRTIELAAE